MVLENLEFNYTIGGSEVFDQPIEASSPPVTNVLQDTRNSILQMLKDYGAGRIFIATALKDEEVVAFVAGCILDSIVHVADAFTHFTVPVHQSESIRRKGIMRQLYKKQLLPQLKGAGVQFVITVVNQDEPGTETYRAAQIADAAFKKLGYVNASLNKKCTKAIRPDDPGDYVLDLKKK